MTWEKFVEEEEKCVGASLGSCWRWSAGAGRFGNERRAASYGQVGSCKESLALARSHLMSAEGSEYTPQLSLCSAVDVSKFGLQRLGCR